MITRRHTGARRSTHADALAGLDDEREVLQDGRVGARRVRERHIAELDATEHCEGLLAACIEGVDRWDAVDELVQLSGGGTRGSKVPEEDPELKGGLRKVADGPMWRAQGRRFRQRLQRFSHLRKRRCADKHAGQRLDDRPAIVAAGPKGVDVARRVRITRVNDEVRASCIWGRTDKMTEGERQRGMESAALAYQRATPHRRGRMRQP